MTQCSQNGRVTIDTPDDVRALLGRELGPSRWVPTEQAAVDAFATATGDRQWIHVDVDRARASELGSTIVHGHLLMGMAPTLLRDVLDLRGVRASLNFGCDRIRFPAPTPTGCRIRLWPRVSAITPRGERHRVELHYRFEREGSERPVCVADCISLWEFSSGAEHR